MKKLLVFLMLFLLAWSSDGQLKTIIGAEAGPQAYIYNLYDEGHLLKNPMIPGGLYGFKITQDINKGMALETGFYGFTYYGYPNFKRSDYITGSNLMAVFQIPLRFKYTYPVFTNKLTFGPHLGIAAVINRDYYTSGYGTISFFSPGDTLTCHYEDLSSYRHFFILLETGIDLNVKLYEDLYFTFTTNYQSGFSKVIQTNIRYSRNSDPETKAGLSSTGDNLQFLLGFNYPVSNIWQKKDYRRENKEKTDRKLRNSFEKRFYIVTEGGPLWRSFKELHGNANIGLKDGRYPFFYFEYANLSLGIRAGMKFYKNIAFESGIYTQYYSNWCSYKLDTFYSSGSGFWSGKTNFTEYPFIFRYYYQLPGFYPFMERIFISPSLGVSILHSKVEDYYSGDHGLHHFGDISSPDSFYYWMDAYRLRKNLPTLNAGLGIEFYMFRNLILFLNGRLSTGFSDFNRLTCKFLYHQKLYEGELLFRGNSSSLNLGIRIPIDFRKAAY